MATVEGIRTPIVIDVSDIPRSISAVEKEIKRLKKQVGDVDIRLNGKWIESLSKKSIRPMIKDFAKLEERALNAKKRFQELGKVMDKVRAGGAISKTKAMELGTMKGVGAVTRGAIGDYRAAQQTATKRPNDPAAIKEMEQAQSRLLALMKQSQGVQKKIINQTKQEMELSATYSKIESNRQSTLQRLRKQNLADQKKEHQNYLRLIDLARQGKLTTEEKIRMHHSVQKLQARGIKFTKEQLALNKEVAIVAKKAGRQTAGLMGRGLKGRIMWFAQLRLLWEIYRIVGAITEEFLELDDATAKAMRTMVRDTKDYEKTAESVRKTIIRVAANTGAAYKDVGEALYQLSSAGLTAKESLAAVSSVVKLATITGAGMTDTTKLVAGAYNNFKESITGASNQTEKFMKISGTLDYVWKRNQVDMNELVQGLNQSAQSGKLAGLSFEQLTVILGNMGTRMIRSGRAGRMLRSAVINIAQKSTQLQKTFGITFDPRKPLDFINVVDKMHKKWKESNKSAATTAAIFDIFGKRGAPAMISILDSWEKIRTEMDGIGDAYSLAIQQQKTLYKEQEHFKALSSTIWKQIMANILDYTFIARNFLKGLRKDLQSIQVYKESQRGFKEMEEMYTSSADVTERLVELEAQRQIRLEQGADATEPMIQNYDRLIKTLTQLQYKYNAIEQQEADLADARKRAIATDIKKMSDGYKETDEQLRQWAIEGKKIIPTLKEQEDAMKNAADDLADIREEYAKLVALVANKDIAEIPKELASKLKAAQNTYLDLVKAYWERRNQMMADAQAAKEAMDPHHGMTELSPAAKEARTATGQASYYKMSTGLQMKELEQKQKLLDVETALDEKYTARNLSQKEADELERQREVEKLNNQNEYINKQLAFNQTQQMMEDQAAEKAIDPEQRQQHLDSLNALQVAEAELQRERDVNDAKIAAAQTSYDQYQRKRIAGLYAEKGAVQAGKAMWQAYGDTIGQYTSSMVDQWANMFAEMGKESKAAWDIYKAIAISQAIVDTFKTAQAGASALAGIPFIGPALAVAWIATSVATGIQRVNMIRQQKPEGKAKGGVFDGFDAYSSGGVTNGVAMGIVGENPSGKELVIPSEHINKDSTYGYVRDQQAGGGAPTIVNMVTQQDIAQAIKESPEGKNVVINHIGRDMNERGSTYRNVKDTQAGNK